SQEIRDAQSDDAAAQDEDIGVLRHAVVIASRRRPGPPSFASSTPRAARRSRLTGRRLPARSRRLSLAIEQCQAHPPFAAPAGEAPRRARTTLAAAVLLIAARALAQEPAPFKGGFPTPGEAQKARDDADYQRAVTAYRFWYPTVSCEGMMNGNRQVGVGDNQ